MKRLIIVLTALAAIAVNRLDAQVRFGIQAGLNLATVKQDYPTPEEEEELDFRPAYRFGLTVDYSTKGNLGFQSGLILSSKGYRTDIKAGLEPGTKAEGYDRMILDYLEVPLNVVWKADRFRFFGGPYVAVGVRGRNRYDVYVTAPDFEFNSSGSDKYKPVFGEITEDDLGTRYDEAFHALDGGFQLGAGYEAGPVLFQAAWSFGMGNLLPAYADYPEERDEYKLSNRVLSLSMTYLIGK